MSQENVERLRIWLEAWNLDDLAKGVFDSSLVDPDVAYEDDILPDHATEVYRGYEGLAHAGASGLNRSRRTASNWSESWMRGVRRVPSPIPSDVSTHGHRVRSAACVALYLPDGRSRVGEHFLPEAEALEAAGLRGRRCHGRTWRSCAGTHQRVDPSRCPWRRMGGST